MFKHNTFAMCNCSIWWHKTRCNPGDADKTWVQLPRRRSAQKRHDRVGHCICFVVFLGDVFVVVILIDSKTR